MVIEIAIFNDFWSERNFCFIKIVALLAEYIKFNLFTFIVPSILKTPQILIKLLNIKNQSLTIIFYYTLM